MTTAAFYIESSIPAGLTIAEYRRSRPKRPSLWRRLAGPQAASPRPSR